MNQTSVKSMKTTFFFLEPDTKQRLPQAMQNYGISISGAQAECRNDSAYQI